MPTSLEVERLISVVATESALLAEEFQKVLPPDSVPSCPDWTAADLLGHIGGVQRWAAAMVAGARTANVPDAEQERLFRTPAEGADPDPTVARALLTWFEEGSADLVGALSAAPSDLRAMHFLKNAPAPRHFWARREAHEVTIHRVDMLAARLGRLPATGEAAIDHDVAVDGIDELVCGFLPRRSSRLRTDEPFRVAIGATDAADRPGWTIAVSADPPVDHAGGGWRRGRRADAAPPRRCTSGCGTAATTSPRPGPSTRSVTGENSGAGGLVLTDAPQEFRRGPAALCDPG